MRKLIIRIVLVVLPFFILAGILEIGLGNVQDEYSTKAKLFEKRKNGIETLFLGASPTAYGIDPSYMRQNAFNMGNFYQLLVHDTALVEVLAPSMPKLKLVVFNLIPPVMELGGRNSSTRRLSYKYHQLYGSRLERWQDWIDLRAYSKTALFGYRNSIDYLFRGFDVSLMNDVHLSELGFFDNESIGGVSGDADDQAMKDQLGRLITPFQGEGNWENNRKILEALTKSLLARKVQVTFIISPVTPQYAALYSDSYRDTKSFMADMQSKYGIKSFDYFRDNRFTGEDFRDFLHLNSRGAIKFSRILDKEVMTAYYG